MTDKKLSFEGLNELYKKDINAYRKYIDEGSWDELINYANEGLDTCEKEIIDSKNFLERTINTIDLSNLYRKYGDSLEEHVN